MEKLLEVDGHMVRLHYKRVKNINMRLQNNPDGVLVFVSAPRRVPLQEIANFVLSKSDWINRNKGKLAAKSPSLVSYEAGSLHDLWGTAYPLEIISVRRGQKVVFNDKNWMMRVRDDASDEKKASLMEAAYMQAVLSEGERLMANWASAMGVRPQMLKTQKMRSRWGSCHVSKGIIKLNSELARKPKYLLEYVLVHELVHLFERGHNARFYGLMDKYLPDWQTRKRLLNDAQ